MADDELREAERAWRATPEDPVARARHAAALRRTGRRVPASIRTRTTRQPREIQTSSNMHLRIGTPDGQVLERWTSGQTWRQALPAHDWLEASVLTDYHHEERDRLVDDLARLAPDRLELIFRSADGLRPFRGLRPDHLLLVGTCGAVTDPLVSVGAGDLDPFLHPDLTGLGLRGHLALPDLGRLAGGAPQLEELDLWAVPGAPADALAPVAALHRLRKLGLSLTGVGARSSPLRAPALAALEELEELRLFDLVVPDEELRALARMRGLRRLWLHRRDGAGSGEWLEGLLGLPLESVRLFGRLPSTAPIDLLLGLPLRELSVSIEPVSPPAWLARLPGGLQELSVDCGPDLQWVGRLPSLRRLSIDVADDPAWDDLAEPPLLDLGPLGSLEGLTHLSVSGREPVRLEVVSRLRGLVELTLDARSAGTNALAPLRHHPTLAALEVSEFEWTDDDLAPLPDLPALRSLRLPYYDSTDATLELLRRCPSLRELTLRRHAITDAGLAAFRDACPDVSGHLDSDIVF